MVNEFSILDTRNDSLQVDASVIIATFNQEWCINYTLSALMNQTYTNFEIIIADDGSNDKTKEICSKYPLFFITQENKGFRKTRIVNEASKYLRSPYVIFLDGDCIPHKDFIKSHIQNREAGTYLAGRRVDMPESLTKKYLGLKNPGSVQSFLLKHFWKLERPNRLLRINSTLIRKLFKQDKIPDMMGCNASFWLEDFRKVDGYDERYVRAHREDGDLCARFQHIGLKIKSLKGLALVYHLWHKQQAYYTNEDLFKDTLETKRKTAVKGLSSR